MNDMNKLFWKSSLSYLLIIWFIYNPSHIHDWNFPQNYFFLTKLFFFWEDFLNKTSFFLFVLFLIIMPTKTEHYNLDFELIVENFLYLYKNNLFLFSFLSCQTTIGIIALFFFMTKGERERVRNFYLPTNRKV